MAEREKPPEGGLWPNNGEVYETSRVWHESKAETCEAAGEIEQAKQWRRRAVQSRRYRDSAYAQHQRRMMNRRVRRGTS